MKTRFKIFFIILFSLIILPQASLAVNVGLDVISNTTALETSNPVTTATRIVNLSTIFLGAIAIIIMLYAGFKFLSASGDEESLAKAKKALISGVIGLVIILSSWAIASFVLAKLSPDTQATNNNLPGNCTASCAGKNCGSDGCGGSCGPCGGQDVCTNGICTTPLGNCAPDCTNKQCGSDSCGGSCGSCQLDQICANDQCITTVNEVFKCGSLVNWAGGPWDKDGNPQPDINDVENSFYKTITEKNTGLCWLAENLNIGTMVAAENLEAGNSDDGQIQKYCPGDKEAGCALYGGLYSWNELMNHNNNPQGLCPKNWHLPSDAELFSLENYYNKSSCDPDREFPDCDPAGTEIQKNLSMNFPGLIAEDRGFYRQNEYLILWTASPLYGDYSSGEAWTRIYDKNSGKVDRRSNKNGLGLSARCILDY